MLKNLKSGSDIRGTAIEGYGEAVNLTEEAVTDITNAFVVFLRKKLSKQDLNIGVGRDSRLSGEKFTEVIIDALKKSGTNIFDAAITATPAMFFLTRCPETDCDGAIMITASHMPKEKNGLKFFTKEGGLEASDIDEILDLAQQKASSEGQKTMLQRKDFTNLYCDFLNDYIKKNTGSDKPLDSLKIIVDAGNGAGGFFAAKVLEPLGANTQGSQFLEPNGNFPNHVPNPEDNGAMAYICNAVRNTGADLGIIFDTDVDRAAFVTSDGKPLNRSKLLALVSSIILSEHPSAYIVTDSVTSDGLRKFIEAKGGYHYRYKRGYKNVINEAKTLNKEGKNAPLAIETSGHAALRENYFQDDGAFLAAKILVTMAKLKGEGKNLESLTEGLIEPLEEAEVRLKFTCENFAEYGAGIIKNLTDFSRDSFTLEPSTFEGVRTNVDYAGGWFLARMSVHDPIMPINIESSQKGGVKLIAKLLYSYFKSYKGIDVAPLEKLIQP